MGVPMEIKKTLGGLAALAAVALPMSFAAAAPAAASTAPTDERDFVYVNAVFGYDRDRSDWGGPQQLLYFEQSTEQPEGVFDPVTDRGAFPRTVCDYPSLQVDVIKVYEDSDEPVVGQWYTADFTEQHGWDEIAVGGYNPQSDPAFAEICAPLTPVTPAEVTSSDVCEPADGASHDTITIPETAGVEYAIDGEPAAAGEHVANGTSATVTATAADGYELDSPAEWTIDFTKEACPTAAPTTTTPTTTAPAAAPTTPAAAPTAAPTSAPEGTELATTGAGDLLPLGVAAIALLGLGGAALATRRRDARA